MKEEGFWNLRPYLLEPIPEIFEAADLLSKATDAHNAGDRETAADLFRKADMHELAQWTEALWGPQTLHIHCYREVNSLPPFLPKEKRIPERMPSASGQRELIQRDGYHCRYCGIPLVRKEVRDRIRKAYPEIIRWGKANKEQHAAFQCMWLTYEHVVPHSRGGDNAFENMIISCQPCNCAKMQYALEELGLKDPRLSPIKKSDWDGLERFK